MLSALLIAIQTLTRIPLPMLEARVDSRTLARSALFYPLVGAMLGLMGLAVYGLLNLVLPQSIVALALVAFWALLTGGLHEDGLADTFDAFGSQRSREDILRVLKDSHIGTYGVVALILAIVSRWQLLALVRPAEIPFALLASQVLPRAGMVALAYFAGAATNGSGGLLAKSLGPGHVAGAVLLALATLVPLWTFRPLVPAAVCLLLVALLRGYFQRKIGGITGDCLGAANQLQEIGILLVVVAWDTL